MHYTYGNAYYCYSYVMHIIVLALWLGEFRIQPTFALVHVVRGDLSWDINCSIPRAHCMLGLLACSEEYEFGQLGTGLSWFR